MTVLRHSEVCSAPSEPAGGLSVQCRCTRAILPLGQMVAIERRNAREPVIQGLFLQFGHPSRRCIRRELALQPEAR